MEQKNYIFDRQYYDQNTGLCFSSKQYYKGLKCIFITYKYDKTRKKYFCGRPQKHFNYCGM